MDSSPQHRRRDQPDHATCRADPRPGRAGTLRVRVGRAPLRPLRPPAPATAAVLARRAVAEEEQELSDAVRAGQGGPRDAAVTVLALAVVVAASAAMERSASLLGARYAVPGVITGAIVLAGLLIPAVIIASPALGGALRIAIWYGILTAATIALALAGRGINRRSGALIIAAYLVFAITVIASAIRPAA